MILLIELVGGWLSGSLALLADAGHVFGDSTAILVNLTSAVLIKTGSRTKQIRDTAFKINIGLLFLVAGWIALESIERFQNPSEIESPVLIFFALAGGTLNYWQHRHLKGAAEEHKHHAHRALSLHVIFDLVQSGAVVLGGIAIWLSGWVIIDPLLSAGIAIWIFCVATKTALNPHGNHHTHAH